MADEPQPTVEKVVETKATTKATTEASAAALISPASPPAADDAIRKWLAGIDAIVFLILVGGICFYLIYHQGSVGTDVLAVLIMVVQAMIAIITIERNYFYGSSSGSTQKSGLLEAKK